MSLEADEHRRVEADLIERDEQLSEILAYAAVGVVKTSLEGQWLWMNKAYCDLLGYSESELRTKTLREITQKDDWDDMHAGRQLLLAGEISTQTLEKRYVRKDGTIRWGRLHRSLVRDRENRPKYFVSVVEDITEKKEAERALWHSEERYRLASKATNDAIWDIDLVTGDVTWNETYSMLYGRPSETSDSWQWWIDRIHPEDREVTVGGLRAALSSRASSWTCEYRFQRADGNWANIYDRAYIARDASGNAWRVIGAMQDLTDRKQAEARLHESEERFRNVADTAPVMIWISGTDKLCTFFNKPWLDFTGHCMEQEVGNGWASGVHPEDLDRCFDTYSSAFDAQRTFDMEYRLRRADGEYRWVLHKGVPTYRGQEFTGYIGSCIDVTEKKQIEEQLRADITERQHAEERLRQSEQRFRNIADTAPVGIWMTGSDGLLAFCNKNALGFVGRTIEQVAGTPGFDLVHPDDRAGFQRVISSSYAERSRLDAEFRVRRGDGTYRWVLCRGVPRFDSMDIFAGYIGSFVDVTDVKMAREEAIARQKMESLGLLAGGVAHDFNNLLGGVLGQAELIGAELPLGSPLSDEIQRIKTAAVRGSEIVRELMVYSGNETRNFEPTDLSSLVEEMLTLLKVSISKRATLQTNLGENLPQVWGNAPEIRQVVMNLITNASEALGEGEGVIEVTTARVADGESIVSGGEVEFPEGGYVLLQVSDTGCGITEEQRPRIFDPFYTTKFVGRGLGLAVVQGIVRSHRGMLKVVSSAGQGTTFQVYLPWAQPSSASRNNIQARVRPQDDSLTGRTVLVVEDEEVLRHSLVRMLRMQGLSVLEAGDGSAAIRLIRRTNYRLDVVLLDLTIPGASSHEVIDEAQRVRPETKLIVASAHSLASAERSLKIHISAFLRKPFQFCDVIHALRETLSS